MAKFSGSTAPSARTCLSVGVVLADCPNHEATIQPHLVRPTSSRMKCSFSTTYTRRVYAVQLGSTDGVRFAWPTCCRCRKGVFSGARVARLAVQPVSLAFPAFLAEDAMVKRNNSAQPGRAGVPVHRRHRFKPTVWDAIRQLVATRRYNIPVHFPELWPPDRHQLADYLFLFQRLLPIGAIEHFKHELWEVITIVMMRELANSKRTIGWLKEFDASLRAMIMAVIADGSATREQIVKRLSEVKVAKRSRGRVTGERQRLQPLVLLLYNRFLGILLDARNSRPSSRSKKHPGVIEQTAHRLHVAWEAAAQSLASTLDSGTMYARLMAQYSCTQPPRTAAAPRSTPLLPTRPPDFPSLLIQRDLKRNRQSSVLARRLTGLFLHLEERTVSSYLPRVSRAPSRHVRRA